MDKSELQHIAGILTEADRGSMPVTILRGLMSQSFVDWYENDFMDFVEGDDDAKDENAILADIQQLFRG